MNEKLNYFKYGYTLVMIVLVAFLITLIAAIFSYYASLTFTDLTHYKENSNLLNKNTVYVEAPVFRTDFSQQLIKKTTSDNTKYLFTSEQIESLKSMPSISEIYYLTDKSLLDEKLILPTIDATVKYNNQEIDSSVFVSTFSNKQITNVKKLTGRTYISAGNYPADDTNRVAVSSSIEGAEIGQPIKINGNKYIISGLIDSNSPQIILPYTADNYINYGEKLNLNYLKDSDQLETYYGNMLIVFQEKPTSKDLHELYSILNNGAIYYQGFIGTDANQFISVFTRVIDNYRVLIVSALVIIIGLSFIYLMIKYSDNQQKISFKDLLVYDLSLIFGAELFIQLFITILISRMISNLYILFIFIIVLHIISLGISAWLFFIYNNRKRIKFKSLKNRL